MAQGKDGGFFSRLLIAFYALGIVMMGAVELQKAYLPGSKVISFSLKQYTNSNSSKRSIVKDLYGPADMDRAQLRRSPDNQLKGTQAKGQSVLRALNPGVSQESKIAERTITPTSSTNASGADSLTYSDRSELNEMLDKVAE